MTILKVNSGIDKAVAHKLIMQDFAVCLAAGSPFGPKTLFQGRDVENVGEFVDRLRANGS